MATRQYIGARYVPKFYTNSNDGSTQWQPNVVYEPLVYVTLTNGHMYISKKEVPATVGTPAENIDYWLDIGSYNGMIEDLQNQIDSLTEDVNTKYNTVEGEIDKLNIRIGTNRKVICIGDSYLGGSGPSYSEVNSWGAKLRELLNNGSDTIIKGVGSTGFVGQFPDHTFQKQLESAAAGLTSAQKQEITDILVVGGINDREVNMTQLDNAITQFCQYAHATFPYAVIRIGVAGWARNGITMTVFGNLINHYKKCATANAANRVQYMSGLELIMPTIPDSGYYDWIHPDVDASWLIARGVLNCMMGGYGNMGINYDPTTFGITPVSDATVTASDMKYGIYDGVASVTLNVLWIQFGTNITYSYDQWLKLGEITSGIPVRSIYGFKIPCSVMIIKGDGNNGLFNGVIRIMHKEVHLLINGHLVDETDIDTIIVKGCTVSGSVFDIC